MIKKVIQEVWDLLIAVDNAIMFLLTDTAFVFTLMFAYVGFLYYFDNNINIEKIIGTWPVFFGIAYGLGASIWLKYDPNVAKKVFKGFSGILALVGFILIILKAYGYKSVLFFMLLFVVASLVFKRNFEYNKENE